MIFHETRQEIAQASASTAGLGSDLQIHAIGDVKLKVFADSWNTKTNYYADEFVRCMPQLVAGLEIKKDMRILELGVGRGVLSLALATLLPESASFTGVDIQSGAPEIVSRNVQANGLSHEFHVLVGDLFAPVHWDDPYDLIIFDLPHIPVDAWRYRVELQNNNPEFTSINGGPDGRQFIESVIPNAPLFLKPGGRLWFDQHSFIGTKATIDLTVREGFSPKFITRVPYPLSKTRFTLNNRDYIEDMAQARGQRDVFPYGRDGEQFYIEVIEAIRS